LSGFGQIVSFGSTRQDHRLSVRLYIAMRAAFSDFHS
jgi:hypothetical protein